ncbi:MAG: ATP-binding protein [Alphaproteobacteria bacterium]|nr:ATP-binding protein [Alphaproteobacteria bacterium]
MKRLKGFGAASLFAAMPTLAYAQTTALSPFEGMSALFFGFLIGAILSATAYLFFIWVVMRDRGQVFLITFLLCLCINILTSNDPLMAQIGVVDQSAKEFLSNLSLTASWIFALFFTFYFLELDINSPSFKTPFLFIGLFLLFVLFYSLIDPALCYYLLSAIGTLVVIAILIAGIAGIRNGTSGSMVHIIAFICFLVGILAEPSYVLGFLDTRSGVKSVISVSFALSSLMFAIVVATQFAARQDEKEKALEVSNERFALATRGANEGLFDWNLQTGEVFFSDQFRKIVGFRLVNGAEGLKTWVRMIQAPYRRNLTDTVRRFRRNASAVTITVEYLMRRPNGDKRWLHSKAVAVRDKNTHKIIRMVGSTSDITERKTGEFALLASEARFRSIIEAHPVPVIIVSLQSGNILYAAPGSEQLLRMKREDIEKNMLDRFMPVSADRLKISELIMSGAIVDSFETTMTRGDGAEIPAAISARKIAYQQENAMVMGIYDLTEAKKAETQIAQQQEALQQSEKMAALGGLLAGVAHELNNPLSVVVGQSTLLMEGAPEPKVASRAEKIFKAADRCSRIVKSFLALARRKPPERKMVNINQIVRGSLELLGYQFKTGEITISSNLDAGLSEAIGDSDQLTQVVTNLVLNAAQALDGWKGLRRIAVTTSQDSTHLSLIVADTGPGIPHEIRSRVFEPFYTTKSSKGGTGVGLSLCLNIVSAHGGELTLTDTEGGGATFTVRLPLGSKASEEADNTAGEAHADEAPLKILIVDDEIELAQTLADLLEPLGHQVDIAINGEVAMEKLRKNGFDLIISDLRMPVMDGPALYSAIEHELPMYKNRIIYVTGDTLSTHVQEFLSAHVFPVVEKPYRLKDIRRSMGEVIENIKKQEAVG